MLCGLVLLAFSFTVTGQTTIILDQPDSGNKEHRAETLVHFQPGYSYKPLTGELMHGYILPQNLFPAISINTIPLDVNIPYQLSFQDVNYNNNAGGIEFVSGYLSQITEIGKIKVAATADYDALEILFDFRNGEISNLRGVFVDSIPVDTVSLDSNYFKVVNGHDLILYQGDTTDLPTDSVLYGLVFEGGLGFSPNGDGNYDVLEIFGLGSITQFNLTITDLTQSVVFTTTSKTNFWTGDIWGLEL